MSISNVFQIQFQAIMFLAFAFPLTSSLCVDKDEIQSAYIKSVRCNVSEKYIHKNFSCYAKSFNRSCSTGTVLTWGKFPINDLFLEARLFYKYGTIYREVMHSPVFNGCQLTKDEENNGIIRQLLQVIKDSAPGLIHPCPYTELGIFHRSVKTKNLLSIFPTGDYKFLFIISGKNKEPIIFITVFGSHLSSDKNSFG